MNLNRRAVVAGLMALGAVPACGSGGDFDIRSHGASPDAEDNAPAFQKAIDAAHETGGSVYVPTGRWRIKRRILMRSHVSLYGDGAGSVIWNTNTSGHPGGEEACLVLGNFGAAGTRGRGNHMTDVASAALVPALEGAQTIELSDAAQAALFKAGDPVFIYSQSGHPDGDWRSYQQINFIEEVSSGAIALRDPLYKDLADGFIGNATRAPGADWAGDSLYVCEGAGVRDVAFRSEHNSWHRSGAMYGCTLENIAVERSLYLWTCNGFARSTIRNVSGSFVRGAINTAYFSHDSLAENFTGERIDGDPGHARALVVFEENCHHTTRRNFKLTYTKAPEATGVTSMVRFAKASEFNTFEDFDISTDDDGPLIDVNFEVDAPGLPKGGNVVGPGRFVAPEQRRPCISISEAMGQEPKAVPFTISDVSFDTSRRARSAVKATSGRDYALERLTFAAGAIAIPPRVRGGISITDLRIEKT